MISVGTCLRNWNYIVFNGQFYFPEVNFNYRETHSHESLSKQFLTSSAF